MMLGTSNAGLTALGRVHARKFIAQDGQEYQWSWRINPGEEWTVSTCRNIKPRHI